jgi:hypothetical protein
MEKKEKESGDSSVNGCLRLWACLPAAVSLLLLEA